MEIERFKTDVHVSLVSSRASCQIRHDTLPFATKWKVTKRHEPRFKFVSHSSGTKDWSQ